MPSEARLAWQVVLEPPGLPQKYEVLVDAVTREVLYRRNRVLYADGVGRVLHPMPPRRSIPSCSIDIRWVPGLRRLDARLRRIT